MQKKFIFKSRRQGTSRNDNQYHMIELHDPKSLENTTFFVQEGVTIDSTIFTFKDEVMADLDMEIRNGKPEFVLIGLSKVASVTK